MENLHSIRFFLQRELARPRIIIKELQNVFLKLEIIAACGDLKMIFPVLKQKSFWESVSACRGCVFAARHPHN
jgi:hypothetical protein